MAPKLKDVTAQSSISVATSSRVLNGTCPVQAKLQQLDLASAAELGYQPNVVARLLSLGKTPALGVIVPSVTRQSFPDCCARH
jgi:DNA-binding LacI/PurR family transcriptional regulator